MGPRVTLFCVVALLMPAAAGAADITFSSFIAPSVGNGIAVGPGGDIFITGNTARSCMDGDVSIIRIAAGGTSFRYIAAIRGGGSVDPDECGYGIVVDSAGNAYVAGETNNTSFFDSANAAIPTTGCSALGDIRKAFVAKLDPNGGVTAVLCLVAGGAFRIAVDGSGRVYVAGSTQADAFVARLNSTFSGTDYLTTFGGSGGEGAWALAVDAAGNAYVAGGTSSTDLPVLGGFQSAPGGQDDGFVARFSTSGVHTYSTYVGGRFHDYVYGLALGPDGTVYVAGSTESRNFPVVNARQPVHGGGWHDGFLLRLSADATAVIYSTYHGGSGDDGARAVAVDGLSRPHVVGWSDSADFPEVRPTQVDAGTVNAFISKFNADGKQLLHSAKIGGVQQMSLFGAGDYATDVALDGNGLAIFTGYAMSLDYPMVNALDTTNKNARMDGIVTAVSLPEVCTYSVPDTARTFGYAGGRTTVPLAASAAGCAWTAASDRSWLRPDTTSGFGTANIGITVDSNPGAFRSGTITIGGLTLVVTQAGAPIRPASLDADADGLADITVWRPSTGDWWTLESSSGYSSHTRRGWGAAADVPIPGDFDGDGRQDLTVWRPSTGRWSILLSTTQFSDFRRQVWGSIDDVPVPADYDGDGRSDLAVFRPSTGDWWILPSSGGGSFIRKGWGNSSFQPVPGDYDGDGRADIAVWQPSTGTWWILTSSSDYQNHVTRRWGMQGDVPVMADYDGDRRTDFAVWRPSTGDWWILSSGTDAIERHNWGDGGFTPVPADYDGDGRADLAVWRASTGSWRVLLSSTSYTSYFVQGWGNSTTIPLGAFRSGIVLAGQTFAVTQTGVPSRPAPLDADADGLADITVWRPSTGDWWTLESSSGYANYTRRGWGMTGDIPIAGDFDGDARQDLTIWRPSTGDWWILLSTTQFSETQRTKWGTSGDVPVPGDYDGDGRTDPAVFRPSTGEWWILPSAGGGWSIRRVWGDSASQPVPGDYDGDGRADLALWQPSTGIWSILTSSSSYTNRMTREWGTAGDVPVAADYDGDRRTDLAVWRPSTGEWWILYSSTDASERRGWGNSSFTPVPADYDGDGRADLAVWRASTGSWYVLLSSTSFTRHIVQAWGDSATIPVGAR
jgi:hypothetical protein